MHLIRIESLKVTARECGNDHLEEVVDVMMEGVIVVPKEHLEILIRGVVT